MRFVCRHLVKPRSMKLCSFISRFQELNTCLEDFPPDAEGQETAHLPLEEIMDIIYHSMPITWKNRMMEQSFNYTDFTVKKMSDLVNIRVEKLGPK